MAAGLLALMVALLAPLVIEGERPHGTLAADPALWQKQMECSQALGGFKVNVLSPLAPIPALEVLGFGRMVAEADSDDETMAVVQEDNSFLARWDNRIRVVCMAISGG